MKKILMLSLFFLAHFLQAASSHTSPVGVWKTIDDETKKPKSYVEIFEKNGIMYGKVTKILNDSNDVVCDKCKGTNKDKPIVGMTIMWNLKKDGSEYSGGKILDPNNGKTYKCYIEVLDGGEKLKVRGYVGFALLGRTQYWYRVK